MPTIDMSLKAHLRRLKRLLKFLLMGAVLVVVAYSLNYMRILYGIPLVLAVVPFFILGFVWEAVRLALGKKAQPVQNEKIPDVDVAYKRIKETEPTFKYSRVLNCKKEKGKYKKKIYKPEIEILLPVEVRKYAETRRLWKNFYVVPWGPICWLLEKNITQREFDTHEDIIRFRQTAERRLQSLVDIVQKMNNATSDPIGNAFSFALDYQEQKLLTLCEKIREPEEIAKEYDTIIGLFHEELDEIRRFIPEKVEGQGMFKVLDVPKESFFAFVQYFIFSRPENPYSPDVFARFCDRYIKNALSYKKACGGRAQKLPEYFNEDWRKQVVYPDVLESTPVYPYLTQEEPYSLPLEKRFEHLVAFAGSGHGKTMLLRKLIEQTDTGFFVLDSQKELVPYLTNVKFDREVIYIDPTDVAHPLAMSLLA